MQFRDDDARAAGARWHRAAVDSSGEAADSRALLHLVHLAAADVPHVPRLAVLDAVDAEWGRWGAGAQPVLAPMVLPAALWRLRAGVVTDEV